MNLNIKVETTDKHLSKFGGLNLFALSWSKLKIMGQISGLLPGVRRSIKKFEDLALGFAVDAECLDDMALLGKDDGFKTVCDERVYTPKTYGDFLREFSSRQIDDVNKALARSAFIERAGIEKKISSMTFDFDSTSNRQYAEVMEGLCFSGEKKYDCLTTMYVFDELGIQYYSDVRPGNTHTSDSISKIIHMVMSQMPTEGSYLSEDVYLPWKKSPYRKQLRVYARADAGYCNSEFMNACWAKGLGFVVRMRSDMLQPNIKNIINWKPAKKRLKKVRCRGGDYRIVDQSIRFYDGRSAEIGSTLYHGANMAKTARIVCIRAKKPGVIGFDKEDYDYFAWLTAIGEHEMKNEKIILFYRGRGHAENYIREMKNGYDMHHYPCLKLDANRAYALIAAFSYNVLRFIALIRSRQRPQFVKAIRNKFINLPCQVVRTGRQVIFKFMEHHAKEVNLFLKQPKNMQLGFT